MATNGNYSKLNLVCMNTECDKAGLYRPCDEFYKIRGDKRQFYPYCKECVEKNVDVYNVEEVKNFLKQINTPFFANIWDGMFITGIKSLKKYVDEMEKKEFCKMTWDDSVFEINKSTLPPVQDGVINNIEIEKVSNVERPKWNEDWQGEYTEKDIEYLNKYMDGLKNDFDISTINHMDYAKEIAKTSLLKTKAYAAMLRDPSDDNIKSYKDIVSMFDNLSKSAQFAESQRGANDVGLGSFGQIFDAVEKHNWVPTYVPDDKDIYDKLLDQFSNIERSI